MDPNIAQDVGNSALFYRGNEHQNAKQGNAKYKIFYKLK